MAGALTVICAYVVGGLTFVPLCLVAFCFFLYRTSPVVALPARTSGASASTADKDGDEAEPVTVYRAGWLSARKTYEPSKDNGDGTYLGTLASSYKSFMDNRSKDPRRTRPKDRFYAVLKQKTLYLYEGEDQIECWAAIEVAAYDVLIYPEDYVDGELFAKRTAIQLRPKSETAVDSLLDSASDKLDSQHTPWFFFARVNSDKEDWYHSLQLSSRFGSPSAAADVARDRSLFDSEDMARLVEAIDQQPEAIPMRWLNALLGRVFLAVYRTKSVEEYITSRIVRKLKRVKLPTMLSEIQVREVQVGSSAPLFSKPMLKELTADGDASLEMHVAYVGNARVTIETEATISLGSRFKPYTVRLVLAIVLKELEGTMLLKVKKPPSNRIWFGFTTPPKMVLSVEPVVSTRQIKWSMVTGPIESRIRELVMEAVVLPHMDDLSFFNTAACPLSRGGIYGDFLRDPEPSPEEELNGPKRDDREVTNEDIPEEELVGEEATTSALAPSLSAKADGLRPTAAMRRRRSSEGDHPDKSAPAVGPLAGDAGRKKSNSSAKSVSSLAGLGASFAQWREQTKNASAPGDTSTPASTSAKSAEGGSQRKSTWFGNGNSNKTANAGLGSNSASASAPDLFTRTPSVLSLASTDTTSSVHPPAQVVEDRARDDISAAKLKDILSKRAASRERERQREREVERARELEADAVIARVGRVDTVQASAAGSSDGGLDPVRIAGSNATPRLTDSPEAVTSELHHSDASEVHVVPSTHDTDTLSLSSAAGSARSAEHTHALETDTITNPPALPMRPSWVRSHSPVRDAASVMSTVSPPAAVQPLPAPPPSHPRHAVSASVDDAGSITASSSTSNLLSSWRTRASDKEALAAGVASAKESMRRWGANWAAKRAAKDSPRSEDFDNVVGESPEKGRDGSADRYREHRRERDSSTAAGSAGYFGDIDAHVTKPLPLAPDTPPRGRAGSLSSSSLLSTSPSSARLVPAASTPSLALSPSTAVGRSSPSTSPQKPSMMHNASSSLSATTSYAGGYGATTGSTYGRRTMAVPGIRNEDLKKKVAEDHLGSNATSPPQPVLGDLARTSSIERREDPPSTARVSPTEEPASSQTSANLGPDGTLSGELSDPAETERPALPAREPSATGLAVSSSEQPAMARSPPPLPVRADAQSTPAADRPPLPARPETTLPIQQEVAEGSSRSSSP
ncbi:hypothetical protein BMF94_3146 [Rhodotorula taiwanensis]|uniref:SMP-LTD domain-containing protein n=1 Tax=Rhodotorula taiwanensis TaxID=741276 RepID=A0A2S5BA16_9BASI|nr:hypothetical protein BMF94_3146 [Rhodotorula taiwanensis]